MVMRETWPASRPAGSGTRWGCIIHLMASPYYQDDYVTLYHGDCLTIDAWLAADVLVTDPPYGIGWKNHGVSRTSYRDRTKGDFNGGHRPNQQIANDKTVAVRDAALGVWGDKPAIVFGALKLAPPAGVRHVAIYKKPLDAGSLTGLATLRRDIEAIYLLGHCEEWERRPTEGPSRASMPQHLRPPSKWRSSEFTTTWRCAGTPHGLAARSGHPHAKPTDVLRDLINLAPGTIADPFAGSGSSLVAAKQLGRKAIGVELDERYCEIAAKRLAQGVLDFGAP